MKTTTTTALNRTSIMDLFQIHQIFPTQQRVEIAQLLFSRSQHLSAEQVLALVNREGATASKATVYNTLGLLAEKGLIRELIVDPSKVFYDSNITHHHHLYDVDTGELIDVDPVNLSLPLLPEGAVPIGVEVIIRIRRQHRKN
ncbi:Fur family transcriptional regulator, iron response regulator [Gammaproteobacteria bacterium]